MATKDFYILGAIVAADSERWTEEDLCPQTFKKAIFGLKKGDELVLHMNSVGGDVHAGMTIANLIRELGEKGVRTVALIEGLAASIASVIACACDTIRMYESSFMMIHRCWSVVQGNSETLRKQADVMDKIDSAILSYYHKHFDMTDEELGKVMDDETWIQGKEVADYKLNCEVISTERQFKVAACLDKMRFNNIPTEIISMENKKDENEKTELEKRTEEEIEEREGQSTEEEEKAEPKAEEEEEKEEKEEAKPEEKQEEEKKVEEEPVEEPVEETETEEPVTEETEEEEEEEKREKPVSDSVEMVTKAEADSRVSGMQSTMQNKINALKKDYEAQITNFKNQLKAKDEELTTAHAEITSLVQKLEESTNELRATASALEEKEIALATLNASVLSPSQVTKDSWRNLSGQEFLDYVTAHKKELSN